MKELEATILILSQLFFTIIGSLCNLLLFITVRDLPNISSSTYHVLLINLSFCNIIICAFFKPVCGIYISFAFSSVSFCFDYSANFNFNLLRMSQMWGCSFVPFIHLDTGSPCALHPSQFLFSPGTSSLEAEEQMRELFKFPNMLSVSS